MASTDSSRYEGDTWDLASSVGATATMVATARALATKAPNPLITDPFAEPLVEAAGMDFFTQLLRGEVNLADIEPDAADRVAGMINEIALRTKFYDEYFIGAADRGIRQAVILASGLDARAYRLPWPAGMTVFELDQPQVIEFKTETLAAVGATPIADRRAVAIDLREDWPTALRDAGFDAGEPTVWSAEGLLAYLPPQAQDRLFDNITAMSAPGSAVATEYLPDFTTFDAQPTRELIETWREHGLDLDMPALVFTGERSHVVDYLAGQGWHPVPLPGRELFSRNGIEWTTPDDDPFNDLVYVSAVLQNRKSPARATS
jgi:methyltransferase (TIGR00027 family)